MGLVWGSNIFADDSLEMLKKKFPGLGSVQSAQKNNNKNSLFDCHQKLDIESSYEIEKKLDKINFSFYFKNKTNENVVVKYLSVYNKKGDFVWGGGAYAYGSFVKGSGNWATVGPYRTERKFHSLNINPDIAPFSAKYECYVN